MRTFRAVPCGLALGMAVLLAGRVAAAGPAADEILRAAGVEAGLAVHVGATDGRIEADLAAGGRFLVHGLALDDASLRAARATVAAAGVCGLATLAKASSLEVLPYPDDFVNLLVCDAAAPARRPPSSG
jgi:hypothetical protein